MTRSIRFRITATAVLAVLAVLLVAGFAIASAQRRLLTQNLDESLEQEIDEVEALVMAGNLPTVLTSLGDDDAIGQVVRGGEVIAASANLSGRGPVSGTPTATTRHRDLQVVGDEPRRLASRSVDGPDGLSVIHVGGSLGDVRESTQVLVKALAVAVPSLVVLLGLLIWWLVGRTLRPVENIRSEVADIGGHDLHRRVPEPPTGDEIARLAGTMNDMLERLDESARRQERFVADASHELRSPLTRIRSELEVDLAHPADADLLATHRSILEEAVGLQQLVDDLLRLARRDADAPTINRSEPVDLDDVVLKLARQLRAADRAIDTSGVGAAQVLGDQDALTRSVANLIDNAVRHAASQVWLACSERDGDAVVTVTDDGPGIPPAQLERVFERFARVDDARRAGTGGTGLGLAIAREIAVQHDGTLVVDAHHTGGARLILTIPVSR